MRRTRERERERERDIISGHKHFRLELLLLTAATLLAAFAKSYALLERLMRGVCYWQRRRECVRACICVERKCVRAIESKRKRWSHRLMEQREIFCHCLNMTNSSEAVATASMSQKKFHFFRFVPFLENYKKFWSSSKAPKALAHLPQSHLHFDFGASLVSLALAVHTT